MGPAALVEEAGHDAVGKRYRAVQPGNAAPLFVELLDEPDSGETSAARKLASLPIHPHLPAIVDAGSVCDRPYLVYRQEGTDVREAELSTREAVAVIRDAALAVEHAASAGCIHPGVRPEHLRVTRAGPASDPRVYVTGFCFAPPVASDDVFASPRRRGGATADEHDVVYSLGAVLYLLVAGRAPDADPEPPTRFNPIVPGSLEAVMMMALAKEPGERFPNAGAFADDLGRWLSEGASEEPKEPVSEPAPVAASATAPRTDRRTLVIGGVVAAAAVAGILLLLTSGGGTPEGEPTAGQPVKVEVVGEAKAGEPAPVPVRVTPPPEPEPEPEPKPVPKPPPPPPPPPPPKVALRSVPEGARVLVNGQPVGTAPLTLPPATDPFEVTVELEGHRPWKKRIDPAATKGEVVASLETLPGRIELGGLAAGTTVHLFMLPDGVGDPGGVTSLWSEEPSELARSLDALRPADVPRVVTRLQALKRHPDAGVRGRAEKRLGARTAGVGEVSPRASVRADGRGVAGLEAVPPSREARLLATASGRRDYRSGPIRLGPGEAKILKARMAVVPKPKPKPEPVPEPKPVVRPVVKPKPEPPPEPKPEPKPEPAPSGMVGVVEYVHEKYGIFVKLNEGATVEKGEVLQVAGNKGEAVALKVERVTGVDARYPHGCAVCFNVAQGIERGRRVFRGKR